MPFQGKVPQMEQRYHADSLTQENLVKAFFDFDTNALQEMAKRNSTADYVFRIYNSIIHNNKQELITLLSSKEERKQLPAEIDEFAVNEFFIRDRHDLVFQKFQILKENDTTIVALQDLPEAVDTLCHPVIEVEIGGKKYIFLIDTGYTFSTIHSSILKELSGHIVHTFDPDTLWSKDGNGVEKREQLLTTVVDTFSIGTMRFVNMPLTITEEFPEIAGIIGGDLLKQLIVTIDCIDKKLALSIPSPEANTYPNFIYKQMTPYIKSISISGKPIVAYLDTGANTTTIYGETVRKLYGDDALKRWYFSTSTYTTVGANSERTGIDTVLKKPFQFYIDKHIITINYPAISDKPFSENERDIIIGMDMLQNTKFTLNGASRRFTIDSTLTKTSLPTHIQERP